MNKNKKKAMIITIKKVFFVIIFSIYFLVTAGVMLVLTGFVLCLPVLIADLFNIEDSLDGPMGDVIYVFILIVIAVVVFCFYLIVSYYKATLHELEYKEKLKNGEEKTKEHPESRNIEKVVGDEVMLLFTTDSDFECLFRINDVCKFEYSGEKTVIGKLTYIADDYIELQDEKSKVVNLSHSIIDNIEKV